MDDAALVPTATAAEISVQLALVDPQGPKGVAFAAGVRETIERPDCASDNGTTDPPRAALDLAPYDLDATTTAVGLRLTCERTFPAGEGNRTTLHLYRREGKTLASIFDEVVEDNDHQRGPGDEREEKSVIIVEPKAGGLADLAVKTTIRSWKLDAPRNLAQVLVQTRRYAWNGRRYVPKK